MSRIPAAIKPYFKIMRLHNLTGSFLLLWPCMFSIALAIEDKIPYLIFALFILGSFVMRSAGCIINDIIDRKIDAKVERTKNRPLVSGKLKLYEALLLLFILLSIGAAILFTLNKTAIILGFVAMIPVTIYPFMKRFTYWPQLFLGLTFNWGALMGGAAVTGEISFVSIVLYIACILWTLGYDTIYAIQDKEDDLKSGVKSTALKLGDNVKFYLYGFYAASIFLFWLIGIFSEASVFYHLFILIGAIQLFWQVKSLKSNKKKDPLKKFNSNVYFGLVIFIATIVL